MTIIVASLFLPQGPQFETDHLDETLMSNLDQSLINIDNDQWKTLRAASPVYNDTVNPGQQSFTQQQNNSQDSLLENYTLPRIKSATAIDQLLTSDEFMANLTSHASKVTTPNPITQSQHLSADDKIEVPLANKPFYRIGGKKNPSVHEFFTLKKTLSGPISTGNGPYINAKGSASTEHLLKNVNKSLLKSTLKHSISSGQVPTIKPTKSNSESTPGLNKNKSQEYIITPKSRAAQAAIAASRKSPVNNDELDLEYDEDSRNHHHIVPKFGGFRDKKNLRLKTTMMLYDQQEIFQNIPWRIVPQRHSNYSIRDALLDLTGGIKGQDDEDEEINWVGTMGIPTDEVPANVLNEIQVKLESDHHCYAVMPNDYTFNGAYFTFCKKTLWPILHYQLPTDDIPTPQNLEESTAWEDYVEMNKLVADQCVKRYQEGDTIWVHDYHLMLVPKMVRDILPNAKIGFFHHVSFPSSELFRCLAHRNSILEGILGANFVAFQSLEYLRHFLQTCNRILMADVTIPDKEIQYQGQIVNLAAIPMGIDPFRIQSRVINDPRVNHWRNLIREKWDGMKLIMTRDSLDKIKGLVQKLKSYEKFLKENPQLIGKITLLQICNVSKVNDSIDLKRQVMIIIDRINSLSVNINIPPPVMFLQQDLEMPQILALYCETDLYWVNSLREGMNLTCHEFITCSIDKHSPLMISEFTGSASILQHGALLINPWDLDHVSKMIKYALFDMSPKLKRFNWKQMMRDVINNDSESWLDRNLSNINSSWERIQERATVDKFSFNSLVKDYMNTHKHFFLFKISSPPTSRMLSILNDLSNTNKNNIVYIMNSFSKSTLETLYNRVSNIGLIAENGAYIKLLNGSWYNMVDNTEWKSEVIKIFDDKVERLPGSYYKIYDSMVVFHTENAEDKDRTPSVIGEAMTHINTVFNESNIHAFAQNNVVYVQQTGLSLRALKFILRFYNSFNEEETPVSPSIAPSSTDDAWQTANEDEQEEVNNNSNSNTQQTPIDFACITGSSSPTIDPIFEFIKQEIEKGALACGHTVVYGSTQNTHALEHVNGLNGLMNIVDRLNRL